MTDATAHAAGGPPLVVSDMDGTLATAETWRGVHAWILANHRTAAARRFLALQLPRVALLRLGVLDPEPFRARWLQAHSRLLRGVSEAGLLEMGAWVVEHHLWPSRRVAAVDAVAAAAQSLRSDGPGAEVILASGAYQPIADEFARRIGAARALGTPLEVRDGVATGGLALPVQYGSKKAAAVRGLAGGRAIAVAFGDTTADIPLLELAERPVAVAPDPGLRRAATARGWEILEG